MEDGRLTLTFDDYVDGSKEFTTGDLRGPAGKNGRSITGVDMKNGYLELTLTDADSATKTESFLVKDDKGADGDTGEGVTISRVALEYADDGDNANYQELHEKTTLKHGKIYRLRIKITDSNDNKVCSDALRVRVGDTGDVNGDGYTTAQDALAILQFTVGKYIIHGARLKDLNK